MKKKKRKRDSLPPSSGGFNDHIVLLKHYFEHHQLTEEEMQRLAELGAPVFTRNDLGTNKTSIILGVAIFNLGYECGQKAKGK